MKLLIFTQRVDLDDPVLSFFHRWIIELARRFDGIIVVCLYEGRHELPANVRVYSLGKESGRSRVKYLLRFYSYIWKFRFEYDAVFIHQNQEYSILGGLIWKAMHKKSVMWRNHFAGTIVTDIAALFCDIVMCTSKYSYTAKYRKTIFMPVGVDTETFRADQGCARIPRSVMSLGRIASSKNIEVLIEALGLLKKNGTDFSASIYGDATPEETAYLNSLKEKVSALKLGSSVIFYRGVPNDETPRVYSRYDIFVNLSRSGALDKTIFESIACGCRILVSNRDLAAKISGKYICIDRDASDRIEAMSLDVAAKLEGLLAAAPADRQASSLELQKSLIDDNSLSLLVERLYTVFHE